MKKVLAIFAIIAFASSFVACKKEYVCTCTFIDGSVISTTYEKMKKSDAKDQCAATDAGYGVLAHCSI